MNEEQFNGLIKKIRELTEEITSVGTILFFTIIICFVIQTCVLK